VKSNREFTLFGKLGNLEFLQIRKCQWFCYTAVSQHRTAVVTTSCLKEPAPTVPASPIVTL